jgi:hypothetical protein
VRLKGEQAQRQGAIEKWKKTIVKKEKINNI